MAAHSETLQYVSSLTSLSSVKIIQKFLKKDHHHHAESYNNPQPVSILLGLIGQL